MRSRRCQSEIKLFEVRYAFMKNIYDCPANKIVYDKLLPFSTSKMINVCPFFFMLLHFTQ